MCFFLLFLSVEATYIFSPTGFTTFWILLMVTLWSHFFFNFSCELLIKSRGLIRFKFLCLWEQGRENKIRQRHFLLKGKGKNPNARREWIKLLLVRVKTRSSGHTFLSQKTCEQREESSVMGKRQCHLLGWNLPASVAQ